LPCDLLPVSLKIKGRLHEFGLYTLGQLAEIPTSHLQTQFGPEDRRVKDLARGHYDTPRYPRLAEQTLDESATLSSVTVSLDLILISIKRLYPQTLGGNIVNRINTGQTTVYFCSQL